MSVNSHQVRREVEGLIERFKIEAMYEESEVLEKCFKELLQSPAFVNHEEV